MNLMWRASCLGAILVFQAFAQTAEKPVPAPSPEKPAPYSRQAAVTQTGDAINIVAISARPLLQTLEALQQKFGWIVDYEDPRYISHLDYANVPGDDSRPQVPAGGKFSVDISAKASEAETLRLVVDSYNKSQNPGRFEVRAGEHNQFYVVGTSAHDEKGSISPKLALFDIPVTVRDEERTIADTIHLICEAAAKREQTKVTLGVSPRNFLEHTPAKIGGTKVPARELLLQCLAATHRNLYWRLLYDPSSQGYFLDIHAAPKTSGAQTHTDKPAAETQQR
jgi:hypothetical protein